LEKCGLGDKIEDVFKLLNEIPFGKMHKINW
jgi:hypothetical protein